MFLPPPFIAASANIAVSLYLTRAYMKLVYNAYKMKIVFFFFFFFFFGGGGEAIVQNYQSIPDDL